MACSLEERKAIKEAAKIEYDRLKDLLDQGYVEDEVNGIADIQAALDNMAAIINEKPEKFKDQGVAIEPETILELNLNSPRVDGKPIEIISGTRFEDGKVTYKVKYPNGNKVYSVRSPRVSADQVDATELGRYGSTEDVGTTITKEHEKLKDEIWRDQTAAMKLFDELADLDEQLDKTHRDDLRELLEKITDPQKQVLNEFKVYLNKKADASGGAVVMYSGKDYMLLDVAEGGTAQGRMSAAEAYVHEMVHMSVEMARKYQKGPLASVIGDMHKLYEQAAKEVKITDLEVNGNKKEAERLWNYMFNSDNGISEFIAYGLTHKKLKDKLATIQVKVRDKGKPETVLQHITTAIIKLWDTIRTMLKKNPESMTADERLAKLVADMWEHNNTTVENNTIYSKMKKYGEMARVKVDGTLVKLGSQAIDILAAGYDKAVKATEGTLVGKNLDRLRTVAQYASPFVSTKTQTMLAQISREMEKKFEDIGMGWFFKQEGTVQMVLNYLRRDDKETTWIEKLGLVSQNIDRHRENIIAKIGGELLKALKGTTEDEQRAITDIVLDLDMRVLFAEYKDADIQEMLKDDAKLKQVLDKEAKKLRGLVKTDMVYNYYMSQTKGLGHYLATHESGSTINRSARHIVDMRGTGHADMAKTDALVTKNYKEVVKTVDRLATLEGILKSNKANRDVVARLMDTHKDGIEKTITYHNVHTTLLADYKMENEIYTPTVKGELKDLKAGWVEYVVAPSKPENIAAMKKRGLRYKGETAVKGMGMYVTMTSGMQKFEKGAAAKINPDKELHNIVGSMTYLAEDKDKGLKVGKKQITTIQELAEKEIKRQMLAIKTPTIDGYIPMVEGGSVVNYGISANKDVYADAVKQDRRTPITLGKMLGEIQEKKEAIAMNKVVLKEIYKSMRANYRRGDEFGKSNGREYIELGPDAKVTGKTAQEYAKRVWDDMPHSIKEEIKKKPAGQKYIAVRRDMASMYFGRRMPSLLNAKIPFTNTTIAQGINSQGFEYVTEYIRLAGDIWQSMVQILKIDTVIKTPKVLLDNIRSNLYLQSVLGQMPWDAVRGQIEMFKATKEYLAMEREKLELETMIKGKKATLADKARLKRLQVMMKDSPVYDTVQAGLFTGVIDELNLEGLQGTTRADELVKKYTGWVPQVVKDVGNALYINNNTWMFKSLMMVLQYSDFVMRTSRYHYLTNQGMNKDVALKMVTDEAVNYDRDLGGALQWTKAMGPWWFFHYFFGANKNMIEKLRDRPSALLMMEFSSMPSPMDAAPWNKQFGYTMYGPVDLALDKSVDYLENPALLRMFGFGGI